MPLPVGLPASVLAVPVAFIEIVFLNATLPEAIAAGIGSKPRGESGPVLRLEEKTHLGDCVGQAERSSRLRERSRSRRRD